MGNSRLGRGQSRLFSHPECEAAGSKKNKIGGKTTNYTSYGDGGTAHGGDLGSRYGGRGEEKICLHGDGKKKIVRWEKGTFKN